MHCLLYCLISLVVGVLGGGYLHFRYGEKVYQSAKDIVSKL